MSTLLLVDAFKPATPLTNSVVNETLWQFAQLSDISQGSVATHFRCKEIFRNGIIAKWKNFENLLIFDKVKAYKNCAKLLGPPCTSAYTAVFLNVNTLHSRTP